MHPGGLDYGPFPADAISLPVTLVSGQREFIFGVEIREDDIVDPGEMFKGSLSIPRTQRRVNLGRERNTVVTIIDRAGECIVTLIFSSCSFKLNSYFLKNSNSTIQICVLMEGFFEVSTCMYS